MAPGARATAVSRQLDHLRSDIEALSLGILRGLNERARRALEVAKEKQRLGVPIRDPYRESQLLDRLIRSNDGPLDAATVRSLFRAILDASVALMEGRRQESLRVGAGGGAPVVVDVRGAVIGGREPVYVAGPCAVENEDQLDAAARGLARLGVRFFRAGAFKPRTSPYAFQGLGERGLHLLRDAAARHGLRTVTEATSTENVDKVAELADVVQIGARNMYNYELLRAVGRTGKPVLLKRAFSATLDEWLNAAEYVALSGSEQIVLCERGIRTFGRETRSTLDVSIVPLARAASRLPVLVDVSHAAGRRDILAPLARAAFACGAHGVMIEVHPDPDVALSDAEQQITLEDFAALQRAVREGLSELGAALAASEPPRHRASPAFRPANAGGDP
jgi:3-deoxy-7-phosphoheptulonate synthase/chorismate mutase